MTNYVTNSSGDATVATTFTPNGVPGIGDTITVTAGHALTNLSGTLGDATGNALTIQAGASVTLSGNLELRFPTAMAGIAFQGGTLNQGGNTITGAPSANGAHLATFASANITWNASAGARLLFSSAQGATSCHLFAKANTTAYAVNINWTYQEINGWGNGIGTPTMNNHSILSGDQFTWHGGGVINCGRIVWRDWGSGSPGEFDLDNLVVGWWNGTGYASSQNECCWRIERTVAGTGNHRFRNSLWYKDAADARTIEAFFTTAYNIIDFSGTRFVNVDFLPTNNGGHIASGCMSVYTGVGSNPPGFGTTIPTGTTLPVNMDDLCVLQQVGSNPHVPSIGGDSGMSFTINGLICDGLGSNASTGEVGDEPICNIPVTINNFLCVHGAGGPNASLSSIGRVNGNRWTIHNAVGVILGETTAAAQHLGDIKNVLLSQPARGNFIYDAGGFLTNQTSHALNYVAYDPADMTGTNETHPTLGGVGYVQNNVAAYVDGYGANDIIVADPGFADSTRHGLNWASSMGFAATLDGLRDALLAHYGVDSTGASITPVAGATPAAYRSYMQAGYTPSNVALNGTGFGGVDIGAYDFMPPPSGGLPSSTGQFSRGFNS